MRENPPDPKQIADFMVVDLMDDTEGKGWLDALGNLDGLTFDYVCAVALELAGRLAASMEGTEPP